MRDQQEILKIYDSILENKNLLEVMVKPTESSYSKLTFADRTKNDEINKALLDDIQTAAETAGVTVTIDFAKTDHPKNAKSGNVSRHFKNAAVDIDFINGKAVSPSNKEVVNKFTDALISMGYNKNAEGSSHPKAVLTFGFPGHDDHVHVSNLSDQSSEAPESSSEKPNDTETTTTTTDDSSTSGTTSSSDYFSDNKRDPMLSKIAKAIGGVLGLKEEFENLVISESYHIPGKNNTFKFGKVIIPKSENEKIKSAVSGVVNNGRYSSNCQNQVTIEHEIGDETFYLEYCGIGALNVSNGDTISRGDVLGTTSNGSDVEVTLYDSSYNQVSIDDENSQNTYFIPPVSRKKEEKPKEEKPKETKTHKKDTKVRDKDVKLYDRDEKEYKKKNKTYDEYRKEPTRYKDPLMAAILKLPFKPFENKYDKSGKMIQKRWGYAADKKPVDPWILQSVTDPLGTKRRRENNEEIEENVKLKENVEKIKRLLK
jgi:hypothetical protein